MRGFSTLGFVKNSGLPTLLRRYHASILSRTVIGANRNENGQSLVRWKSSETAPNKVELTDNVLTSNPYDFVDELKRRNINRCFMVCDKDAKEVKVSHPDLLSGVKEFFEGDKINYLNHEGVFLEVGERSGALLGAFVWRTNRGQACGGIRLWQYDNMADYLVDGLRLGQGMGVKSALAGLWAGGGKGVIASPPGQDLSHDSEFRRLMFEDYGDFLTSLNGCYVAAEDVGLIVNDLNNVHLRTRYTTCIGEELGGSGNPSEPTGRGVVSGMEAALDFLGMGSLQGKSVAIQGAGNVAIIVIKELLDRGVGRIYAADCNEERVSIVQDMFEEQSKGRLEVAVVPVGDNSTLYRKCDVVSPCALGNVLTPDTIPHINAKVVCGAANNQLRALEDNKLMAERGITFVVDFLVNRMGIVNCANEAYGRIPDDPAINRHFDKEWENSIFVMTQTILRKAANDGITPVEAANDIADKLSLQYHPIWPGRSQKIIESLVKNNWHLSR